jgi:hypothetical protein
MSSFSAAAAVSQALAPAKIPFAGHRHSIARVADSESRTSELHELPMSHKGIHGSDPSHRDHRSIIGATREC